MNPNSKDNNNDNNNDCKPSVQEKKQANEKKKADEEGDYTTDLEKPPKKKRHRADCSKSRFSLCCEVFCKDLDLDADDEPTYIDQSKFKSMAQEAQQRIHE